MRPAPNARPALDSESSTIRPRLPAASPAAPTTAESGVRGTAERLRVDGKGRWDRSEPMDKRHDAQKRKLLDAAAELLGEQGLGALSVEAVTERAQVGRRTFYIHFEGRSQLLLALHASLSRPLFTAFDEAARSAASPIDVVLGSLAGLLDYLRDAPLQAQFVLVDGPALEERHAKITDGFFDALVAQLVVAGLHAGAPVGVATAQILVLGARGAALAIPPARRAEAYPGLLAELRALTFQAVASKQPPQSRQNAL